MSKFTYKLFHKAGIKNRADGLSRRPDYKPREKESTIILPPEVFVNTISAESIDEAVRTAQELNPKAIALLVDDQHPLEKREGTWWLGSRMVIVGNDNLKRGVISLYHDFSLAGHPGSW